MPLYLPSTPPTPLLAPLIDESVQGARFSIQEAVALGSEDASVWYEEILAPMTDVERSNHTLLSELFEGLDRKELAWRYIVLHHTAVESGSVERISRFHASKFEDRDGIQYHFVIGNGRGMERAEIALGRWVLQKRAIHLFHPARAPDAIAIALVGNFEERGVPQETYDALLDLVWALSTRYAIPVERITTHRGVDGCLTQCPGRYFPLDDLLSDVRMRASIHDLGTSATPVRRAPRRLESSP